MKLRPVDMPDTRLLSPARTKAAIEAAIKDIVGTVRLGQPFHVMGVAMVYVGRQDDPKAPMPDTCIRDPLAEERLLCGTSNDAPLELLGERWCIDGYGLARDEILKMNDGVRSLAQVEAIHVSWQANRRILRRKTGRDGTVGRGGSALKPVFIVGNGPSLAKNQDALARIDPTRAQVIYTNRIPEGAPTEGRYYGSIDWLCAEKDGRPFLDGREQDCAGMTAIFDLFVAGHMARLPWKRRLWLRTSCPTGRWSAQMCREFPWITPVDKKLVSVYTLLCAAIVWEAPAVVLVGQDLALGPNKELHVGETVDWDLPDITDINGEKSYTTMNLYRAARCVSGQMELQRFLKEQYPERPCPRFINATEGGIVRQGCDLMTLAEAIEETGVGL